MLSYLLATYWPWLVLAWVIGVAVGFLLSWRMFWSGLGGVGVIAFVIGLVIAVLHWLPDRAGLYLETLLHLSFWYYIGGLIGGWLRNAKSRAELAAAARAAEDAHQAALVQAAVDARLAAAARAEEDARCAAASWAAEEARRAAMMQAAEDARLAAAAAAAAAAQAEEDARVAAVAKATEDARLAAAAKAAEDVRLAAAAKAALEAREAEPTAQVAPITYEDHPGDKPAGHEVAPVRPDDLKRIRGIGPQNEGRLHGLGIWHFSQIAAWTPENVQWVTSYLAFHGRIEREHWIEQARELGAGRETQFSRRVAAGEVPTSKDDGSSGQHNVQDVHIEK
jgi:predicted flap endonuclease-1-like 5' DNA nuclease